MSSALRDADEWFYDFPLYRTEQNLMILVVHLFMSYLFCYPAAEQYAGATECLQFFFQQLIFHAFLAAESTATLCSVFSSCSFCDRVSEEILVPFLH